jgi:magnesium-transporting ATPase (P-type)
MLTGDNRRTAEAVAKKLGIDEFEVLPDQKIERVPPFRVNEMINLEAGSPRLATSRAYASTGSLPHPPQGSLPTWLGSIVVER